MTHIASHDVFDFIPLLEDKSVDLLLTDPPYMNIVDDKWDKQWKTVQDYVDWMYKVLEAMKPKMKDHGSVIFFGGIGSHNERPFFKVMDAIESKNLYTYRNFVTWGRGELMVRVMTTSSAEKRLSGTPCLQREPK